nr:hypothetical protein [Clostridia bacterium]
MNKIKRAAVFALVLASVCAVSVSAQNDGGGYSTENDPLVTLSYVEKVKSQMYDEIYAKVMSDIAIEIEKAVNTALAAQPEVTLPEIPEIHDKYEVVSLNKGQSILAGDACEMILRSGTASVVVTDKVNIDAQVGLSDLTGACELLVGTDVPRNHYIIVSRGDGRGMCATSDIIYLMVRGEYQIVS